MLLAVHVPCLVVFGSSSALARGLSEGDPIAVATVIGWIGGMLLGFVAGRAKALDEARRMAPAEILAEAKTRRFHGLIATVIFFPLLVLGFVSGFVVKAPALLGIVLFIDFFQAMFFTEIRQRCPACGACLVYGYRKVHKVCPDCSAQLE